MINNSANIFSNAAKPRLQRSIRGQITEWLRDQVVTGKLSAGSKLPPTGELATFWGTSEPTIHQALIPLVKEGLLRRTPRLGTFVQVCSEKLTRVGIYNKGDNSMSGGSHFLQAMNGALQSELHRKGIEVDVWTDTRSTAESATPWPALVQAAQEHRIQGLIVPQTDWPHLGWLRKLPVPEAYITSADLPNSVTTDTVEFVRLAMRELKQLGCASVGMLPAVAPLHRAPEAGDVDIFYVQMMDAMVESARDLGLAVREEWVCMLSGCMSSEADLQRFWHEKTAELLALPERPDGLIVSDDIAAIGIVAALLEQGVKVPETMKLVIYKNSDVDLFCPLPATMIEVSASALAAALVEQIERQFRGEPCTRIKVGFKKK